MTKVALAEEALRDLATGTTRAAHFAILLGLAFAGLATFATTDITRAIVAANNYQASGASVSILRAEGRVDGAACDRFIDLPDVRAAGALRGHESDLIPSALPSSSIPTKDVTQGFRRIVRTTPDVRTIGVTVSNRVAESLGLRTGDELATQEGTAHVAATYSYPADGRQGDLGYAILQPKGADDKRAFDECWIEVWPENHSVTNLLRTTLRRETDVQSPPTVKQLNGRFGSRFSGADHLGTSPSLWAPALAGVAGLTCGFAATRMRRLELASARHAGVTMGDQALGQALQSLVWIGSAVAFATPVAIGVGMHYGPENTSSLVASGLATIGTGASAALAGVLAGVLTTRERQLFRYFKDR